MACGQPARSGDGDQFAAQHLEMQLKQGKASKCKSVSGFRAVTPDIFQSRCLDLAPLLFVLKHFYIPGHFFSRRVQQMQLLLVCFLVCFLLFFFFQKLSSSLGHSIRWPSICHCVIHEVPLRTAGSLLPHNNGSHWVLSAWKMGPSVFALALFTSVGKAAP